MELCTKNYRTLDSLVNDVDEMFKEYTKNASKLLLWINFHNLCNGFNAKLENSHIYK
jgi:hypothetical protein